MRGSGQKRRGPMVLLEAPQRRAVRNTSVPQCFAGAASAAPRVPLPPPFAPGPPGKVQGHFSSARGRVSRRPIKERLESFTYQLLLVQFFPFQDVSFQSVCFVSRPKPYAEAISTVLALNLQPALHGEKWGHGLERAKASADVYIS
ncbi:hypothetical protein SKAU_G00122040 [Synaphobranchus kaupii]|uniref:Uncharacterized protein n=1 Tax=Synaphobranchus kaupii TaxID=118154 RepID=A0A9Q1FNX0_SYNKA|nr:hypothetical protein SKAU_G00122040 [Synaphobranchus kaupii]